MKIKFNKKTLINGSIIFLLFGIIVFSFIEPKITFFTNNQKQPDFIFEKVTITQLADGQPIWEIRANSAQIDKNQQIISLQSVTGNFFQKKKNILNLSAFAARFNIINTDMTMQKAVANFHLPERTIYLKAENLVWQAEKQKFIGTKHVEIFSTPIKMTGTYFLADLPVRTMRLSGHTRATIENERKGSNENH